jgi:hypothetical protein
MNLCNRSPRLLCASSLSLLFALCTASGIAWAERFELEGTLVETATSRSINVGKDQGELANFFDAQKKLVAGILKDLGIPLDSLPPEVRNRLGRYHTTNFDAFKLFSQGLDAQDMGRFSEAKALFEKALQLDPGFALAAELSISMPNTNLTDSIQLQAALSSSSKAATNAGKVQVQVDLSQAIAALQSGQTVLVGSKLDSAPPSGTPGSDFTSNPPGSSDGLSPNARTVLGLAYTIGTSASANPPVADQTAAGVAVAVASTNEWTPDQIAFDAAGLARVGDTSGFSANRATAQTTTPASYPLSDGSSVTWGTWSSNTVAASAAVTTGGTTYRFPELGESVHFMYGSATSAMPTTGSATFSATSAGSLGGLTGSIGVNFVSRAVTLNNLSFDLGGLGFTNLTGSASYGTGIGSGFFSGNYNNGTCVGCTAFSPAASSFTGNFVGANADGLIYSTILQTGSNTVSGVHLLAQ